METSENNLVNSTEIIKKIEEFEFKKEINKFFLIMFVSGYIGIISSFIVYVFHYFYQIYVTFYIFQDIGSQSDLSFVIQPILFVIVWGIHIFPLLATFLYTSETTGIMISLNPIGKLVY